ncbi:hypothetical protein BH18ACT6_BH18ACT6_11890 [soil metagenome]
MTQGAIGPGTGSLEVPEIDKAAFIGVLAGDSPIVAAFDGTVTSIAEDVTRDGPPIWVTVESAGIITVYQLEYATGLATGAPMASGDVIQDDGGRFLFIRFETPDGQVVDPSGVLGHVGCDLTAEPVQSVEVSLLDGSRWNVELSAPLLAGVYAQPYGRLQIDGQYLVDVTAWKRPPDPLVPTISGGALPELVIAHQRSDGLRAETWKLDAGGTVGYRTWVEMPDGRALIFDSGSPHDFAAELVQAISFDGQALYFQSDGFVIDDQSADINLWDPTALFAGVRLHLASNCQIGRDPLADCDPPTVTVDSPTPSQEPATREVQVIPAG